MKCYCAKLSVHWPTCKFASKFSNTTTTSRPKPRVSARIWIACNCVKVYSMYSEVSAAPPYFFHHYRNAWDKLVLTIYHPYLVVHSKGEELVLPPLPHF